jgi:hypothetical protein
LCFALCGIPSTEPGGLYAWIRKSGKNTLSIFPSEEGYPFGVVAFRLLALIGTLAGKSEEGSFALGASWNHVLRRIGMSRSGANARLVKEQLARIGACSYVWHDGKTIHRMRIWLDGLTVSLNADATSHFRGCSVPLLDKHIEALGKDTTALRLYAWLAESVYRGREVSVPLYGLIRDVTDIRLSDDAVPTEAKRNEFSKIAKAALGKITKLWGGLNCEIVAGKWSPDPQRTVAPKLILRRSTPACKWLKSATDALVEARNARDGANQAISLLETRAIKTMYGHMGCYSRSILLSEEFSEAFRVASEALGEQEIYDRTQRSYSEYMRLIYAGKVAGSKYE